ncbi:D-3-phosphoglycerate dehydrogenase [Paraburkholderia sp. BL27I4N3]|nr:D-3-phosphoglycerate dehydrogenase [Paraburkholderia sp. BL27I4N3]
MKTTKIPAGSRIRTLATAPLNDYAQSAFSKLGEVIVASDASEDALIEQIGDATAMVVRGAAPITARVLDAAPNLRVMGRTGVGYDTIDVDAATARGIPLVYTPGVGARAVAEAGMTFMLALCKRTLEWDAQLKRGNWDSRYQMQGGDLDGKTLGIVGFGRIGQALAQMTKPFEMKVIAYDPFADAAQATQDDIELVNLDELLERSDFVSLHCPQTPETRGLINGARIAQMRRGAFLINLARGGVIESLDVLHQGLASGQLAGVALDVFDPAPPDIEHPLFKMANCITSPHSMATTLGAMTRIFKSMTDDMLSILAGEAPRFVANPETLKTAATA